MALPADVVAKAREAGTLDSLINAQLGRAFTGRTDSALRCVAATDIAAGSVIRSAEPGAARGGLRKGDPVAIVDGTYEGRQGTFLGWRPDGKLIMRLEGDGKLLALPQYMTKAVAAQAAPAAADVSDNKKRRVL